MTRAKQSTYEIKAEEAEEKRQASSFTAGVRLLVVGMILTTGVVWLAAWLVPCTGDYWFSNLTCGQLGPAIICTLSWPFAIGLGCLLAGINRVCDSGVFGK